MTIAAASLKVITPKKKWNIHVAVGGEKKEVSVRASDWGGVLDALGSVLGKDGWVVLRAG